MTSLVPMTAHAAVVMPSSWSPMPPRVVVMVVPETVPPADERAKYAPPAVEATVMVAVVGFTMYFTTPGIGDASVYAAEPEDVEPTTETP